MTLMYIEKSEEVYRKEDREINGSFMRSFYKINFNVLQRESIQIIYAQMKIIIQSHT